MGFVLDIHVKKVAMLVVLEHCCRLIFQCAVHDMKNLTFSAAYAAGYPLTSAHWSVHRYTDFVRTISRFRAEFAEVLWGKIKKRKVPKLCTIAVWLKLIQLVSEVCLLSEEL